MTLPIRVWLTPSGANPWKVVNLLEELNVPYELVSFPWEGVKQKPFLDINPNGRVPAIEDPNTGLTLWESGAIIQYLIEQYDTEHRLSYGSLKERHLCNQWLMFQVSGQGPYFGQASWFNYLHPEKVPSAIDRYKNEIKRVLSVLDGVLAAKPASARWLVGDRITFADLAFAVWHDRNHITLQVPREDMFPGAPHVEAWHKAVTSRPAWKRTEVVRIKCLDEGGFDENGVPKGMTLDTIKDHHADLLGREDKGKEQAAC